MLCIQTSSTSYYRTKTWPWKLFSIYPKGLFLSEIISISDKESLLHNWYICLSRLHLKLVWLHFFKTTDFTRWKCTCTTSQEQIFAFKAQHSKVKKILPHTQVVGYTFQKFYMRNSRNKHLLLLFMMILKNSFVIHNIHTPKNNYVQI